MKSSILVPVLVLLSGVGIAQAHTHLQKYSPADGSTVAAAPTSVVLTFSEAARVTAAWIQKNDGSRTKLGPLPEKAAGQITIPLPPLTPGTYVVSWRAAGDDGHVMPGQMHFILSAADARKEAGQQH